MAKEIGNKREKKINVSVKEVEEVITELLNKYNIDIKIESYIYGLLDDILNIEEINENNNLKNNKKYKYQFGVELYDSVYNYLTPIIKNAVEQELNKFPEHTNSSNKSDEYKKLVLIYDNIFQQIDLTMYNEGIKKLKLVAFHYLLKCLENKAEIILKEKEIKTIRGYKTAIEVFSYELLGIIAEDKDLEKFTLTLRSLIEQWLVKYNNRSKIGQFYYDVLMINPEQVIEKILRYLLFTAIKNVNPITLRAIFSTYITLIHKNIFSFYAMKLQNIKVGYFRQLESLFEDSIINNTNNVNINQMITSNRLLNYAMKNKRFLKYNYEFLLDEYSSSFFDINYYDFLYSYRKDINILDYHFYYSKILKLTNNSFRSQSKLYRIDSKLFKKNSKKTLSLYINDLVTEKFFNYFYDLFKDEETVKIICESITDNLLKSIHQHNFASNNFQKINLSNDDYINQLMQVINSMGKLMD